MKVQAELGARHHRPVHVHNHLADNYGDCVEDNGPGVLMLTMVIVHTIIVILNLTMCLTCCLVAARCSNWNGNT